jgi:dihydrofolate synthase/folylpolyglutamate synthase
VVGVISVLQGKDADGFFAELSEHLVELVITRSGSDRAMSTEDLVKIASKYFEPDSIHVEPKPYEALVKAKQLLPDNGNRAVLVSGSITLIGDILQQVQLLEGQ